MSTLHIAEKVHVLECISPTQLHTYMEQVSMYVPYLSEVEDSLILDNHSPVVSGTSYRSKKHLPLGRHWFDISSQQKL